MMMTATLLAPVVFITVIATASLLPDESAERVRRWAVILAPAAVFPAAGMSVVDPGARLDIPWMLFGTTFELDSLGRPLLLVSALLYGAALVAVGWRKKHDRERGTAALSAFLLASYVGNIGVYLAADTVAFYLAFAVMSFSAVGLVIHYRTEQARRATIIYLILSVLSETALLAGLMMVVHAGGVMVADAPQAILDSPYTGLILSLLFIGFGIKAGIVPLHVWLPLAHPAAPPAASAVLSGAMVKAGLLGWLRFFPSGEAALEGNALTTLAWIFLALSLFGTFAASLVGVFHNDPKVILAYSTISQIGFIGAVVAAGILRPEIAAATTTAALLYAAHHCLAKGALFLGVPVIQKFGRGATGIVVLLGMVWAGLAIAGAPWTTGAFAKYVSKEGAADLAVFGVGLDKILPFVAVGSVLLLLRFAWVMWQGERSRGTVLDGELIGWLLVCLAGLTVPWGVGTAWLGLDTPTWNLSTVWDMVWPILLGLLLGSPVWYLAARSRLPRWTPRADGSALPPGDLVVVEEIAVTRGLEQGQRALDSVHAGTQRAARKGTDSGRQMLQKSQRIIASVEERARDWTPTGLLTLLLLGAAAALTLVAWGWSL